MPCCPPASLHPCHDPRNPQYVDPSRWCITRDDLDLFEEEVRELWQSGGILDDPQHPNQFHNNADIGPSMYRVNECYIKPKTAEQGMSWALMRHEEGLECDVFATHAWIEGVFEFVSRMRHAWPPDAKHLYVCFLANPQNGDISAMLDCDVLQSPFAKALNTAKYVIVIPNRYQSIYLRLWCVLEAYIAVRATEQRGLVIKMPIKVSTHFLVEATVPGLLLLVVGFVLGEVSGPIFGRTIGPLSWQLFGFLACSLLWQVAQFSMGFFNCSVRRIAWGGVTIATIELCIVGVISGIGAWQLRHFASRENMVVLIEKLDRGQPDHQMTIQHGQQLPVILVAVSMVLLHMYGILLAIHSAVLKLEEGKLAFDTVRDAECSHKADEQRIKKELWITERSLTLHQWTEADTSLTDKLQNEWGLQGMTRRDWENRLVITNKTNDRILWHWAGNDVLTVDFPRIQDKFPVHVKLNPDNAETDKIDLAIKQLKNVGRYDQGVKFNLDKGMCVNSAREGINPCKVCCACLLWSFWWVTDWNASIEQRTGVYFHHSQENLDWLTVFLQLLGASVCLALVYSIGERAVFAVNAAMWFGVFFLLLSLSDHYWNLMYAISKSMSGATTVLQIQMLVAMLIVDALFYTGCYAAVKALFSERTGVRCQSCDGSDRHKDLKGDDDDDDDDFAARPLSHGISFDSGAITSGVSGLLNRPYESYGSYGSTVSTGP